MTIAYQPLLAIALLPAPTNITFTADPGVYSISGDDVQFIRYVFDATGASYSIGGDNVTLTGDPVAVGGNGLWFKIGISI